VSAPAGAPVISDYEGFDFRALWRGREKVTEVERSLLTLALSTSDRRRLLEVGTGFGRLLGTLEALGDEVVATDFDLPSLQRLPSSRARGRRTLRVAANLYHLPFADGSFTGATLVRVYHHLSDPGAALRELRRVLSPGGRLLLSYNPKPTVGTLVNDIQRALHPSDEVPFRSITFARSTRVELPPDPFPVYVEPRTEFERTYRASGFERQSEVGSGLEEYYLMRHVPAAWFVRLGTTLGGAPGFPMRFALLETPRGGGSALPDADSIFACPSCGGPLPGPDGAEGVTCDGCGFVGPIAGGVLDLRYVPDGSPQRGGNRVVR
jgi:SAM-dependent methyltransferase